MSSCKRTSSSARVGGAGGSGCASYCRRRQRRRRHIASSNGANSHRGHESSASSHTHKRGHGAAQEPRERTPGASASAEGRKGTLPLSDQSSTPIPLISWCGRLFSGGLATSPNAFFHAGCWASCPSPSCRSPTPLCDRSGGQRARRRFKTMPAAHRRPQLAA